MNLPDKLASMDIAVFMMRQNLREVMSLCHAPDLFDLRPSIKKVDSYLEHASEYLKISRSMAIGLAKRKPRK